MIDLHIHTNNSGGTDTVEELLQKAQKLKLDYISITDHDTCSAYRQIEDKNIRDIFSGQIIPGIEMKCSYKNRIIEVLGYKINTNKMENWLNEFYKDKQREKIQVKYFNILYEKAKSMGLILSKKEDIIWNSKNDWASFVIYSDLKKYIENKKIMPNDMWEEFSSFNRKYCANSEHILFIDKSKDYPTIQQAICAIKNTGGLVFMPHLYIYKWVQNKEIFIKDIIDNYNIDGIECYYTDFNEEQTQYLLDICNKYKLFISGGSDYHGLNKERINLARGYGNLKIEKEIILNWV